jgi:asparagine synthase (glutamine-hydrolysing)
MCGIAGKYYYGSDREVEPCLLEKMADTMSHRGPDDQGVYRGKKVALSHRRLSILDLSPAGHQPMCNEDGTIWVVFNGEIYNYKSLRAELRAKGHTFRSNTDTEVIVHAYEEYSLDCVKHFEGMFAFGIWDEPRRRLLLARDHFGIKPLYYFVNDGFISFASEIKALLQDSEIPRGVDTQALSNFMTFHYVPAPRTMFRGICKLLPGHMMVADPGQIRNQRYWNLEKKQPLSISEPALADLVFSELKASVQERLQSDVPVGTLLSGGLDSTAVLGLMTELGGAGIPSFSVGYSQNGNDGFSEFAYSRLAATHFKSQYHEVVVTPKMFLDFLPKAVWYQDEPIGEPASVPLYYVCKEAKDYGITVMLSGEGADELFAGYNRHRGEVLAKYSSLIPKPFHRLLQNALRQVPRVPIIRKGYRSMALESWWERYQSWHTVFPRDLKEHIMDGVGSKLTESFEDVFQRYDPRRLSLSDLDKLLWLDLKVWLPDDLLMKKDKMGMATSIEARVPFLDHHFAQLIFNIEPKFKVRKFTGKYIFKKAMERLLPKQIIYRKKAGFPTPIAKWIAQDLKNPFTEILSDTANDHGYFDRNIVKKLLDEHVSGKENHERLLFPILNFDLWYQSFFSNTANIPSRTSSASITA